MGFYYTPPAPIIYQICQERSATYNAYRVVPYFYEVDGKIINLAAATSFYIDHIPLTSLYWPKVKIGISSYQLTSAMRSEEEAMTFLRDLVEQIECKIVQNIEKLGQNP